MDSPARFIDPRTLLEKINTARELVGAALQRRCDLLTASRLLQTDGVQLLVGQFKEIFHDGKLDLSIHESSNEGQNPGQKSLTSLPSPFRLRLLFGTSLVQLDGMLKALDLSGHPHLERLPVAELLAIKSLERLEFCGCPRVVSALLQTDDGVKDLVALLQKVKLTTTIFVDGKLDLSKDGRLMKSANAHDVRKLVDLFHTPLFIMALTQLDGMLTALDLSGHPHLERLPVAGFLAIKSLERLECKNCPRLYFPPPEIARLGGEQTILYLKLADPKNGGQANTAIELIFIGRGESGKTSVKDALMKGKAEKIAEDNRTVGIVLDEWNLAKEASGLTFRIKDLAGQAVYGLTNQFFLVLRAIFVLVWRVLPNMATEQATFEKDISDMVSTWMDSIQLRVPGSTVIVVATHIDCATKDAVDLQCKWVKALVETKLQQFGKDELVTGILALRVLGMGESCRVCCLDGTGVTLLRRQLIELAHSLPWWQESIPPSFLELQNQILERKTRRPWLSWAEYAKIASECDLEGIRLEIATRFLHDNATLKFFGKYGKGPVRVDAGAFQLRFKSDESRDDWGWRVVVWPAEKGSALLSFDEAAHTSRAIVLESAHPYADDCDETHTIRIPGATALWVAFDERSRTEEGFHTVTLVKMNRSEEEGREEEEEEEKEEDVQESRTWGKKSYSGTDYECWPHAAAELLDCVYIGKV